MTRSQLTELRARYQLMITVIDNVINHISEVRPSLRRATDEMIRSFFGPNGTLDDRATATLWFDVGTLHTDLINCKSSALRRIANIDSQINSLQD